MLAIIKATEAWCHYLEVTPYAFEIHTDHNNLLYFMKSQNLSKQQACWQQWMTRFLYQLIYKEGSQMHMADLLVGNQTITYLQATIIRIRYS